MAQLRRSLFLKILLVFLVAAIAHVAVLRYFQHNFLFDDNHRVHRTLNMGEYGMLLSHQLDYPIRTSEQKARLDETARRLHLQIRLMGPDGDFVSGNDVPTVKEITSQVKLRQGIPGTLVGRVGDKLALVVERKDQSPAWSALFLLESENALDQHPQLIAELVALLSLVLLLCFLAVRFLLAPLIDISFGVAEVAGGNLAVELTPSKSGDELSQLAVSFNSMLKSIRSMLSLREQLLLDISHEFRSPLTRIRVAMELMSDPANSEARMSIGRSVRDLEAMTAELLESARLNTTSGGLRLEPLKIETLLRDLVSVHEDTPPGVQLRATLPSGFEILADPLRLQTALRNLIENALKYSAESTRPVEISAAVASLPRVDSAESNKPRPKIRALMLTVEDFGVGIPRDELDSIFEPFYRIDRSRRKSTGGYGLGLALTRKIIEAHGGRIEVQSETGQGSIFRVTLPLPNNSIPQT